MDIPGIAAEDAEQSIARHAGSTRANDGPTVLDLFAGCGGMSLGFQAADFRILGGIEKEPRRAETHAINLFRDADADSRAAHAQPRDVTHDPNDTLYDLYGRVPSIDVIVGGPPCQAYARVGRAKLREIAAHPEAYLRDARGSLYAAYMRYVDVVRPRAVVMENVPDILSYGGVNIGEEIAQQLDDRGYCARYTLLNAVHYGVPQTRERWFLIAFHKDVGEVPRFPQHTHRWDLPPGYKGTRSHASWWTREDHPPHAVPLLARPADGRLPEAITSEDALSDLARIDTEYRDAIGRGRRDLSERWLYSTPPLNQYQARMRAWPDSKPEDTHDAHAIRFLPRDFDTFRDMDEGDEYPAALRAAERRLASYCRTHGIAGPQDPRYAAARKSIVPPYDPSKFPNKWRKLVRSEPSRTLMAHLSHDSYSHIHYDSEQGRTISVREAARLQSFPDRYRFSGAMNAAFAQLGNAVPPLVSLRLAHQVLPVVR